MSAAPKCTPPEISELYIGRSSGPHSACADGGRAGVKGNESKLKRCSKTRVRSLNGSEIGHPFLSFSNIAENFAGRVSDNDKLLKDGKVSWVNVHRRSGRI